MYKAVIVDMVFFFFYPQFGANTLSQDNRSNSMLKTYFPTLCLLQMENKSHAISHYGY